MTIQTDNALSTLAGLGKLTTIGNNFTLYNNTALTSLSGLTSLATIGAGGSAAGTSAFSTTTPSRA